VSARQDAPFRAVNPPGVRQATGPHLAGIEAISGKLFARHRHGQRASAGPERLTPE
jgi:hypothetical protein